MAPRLIPDTEVLTAARAVITMASSAAFDDLPGAAAQAVRLCRHHEHRAEGRGSLIAAALGRYRRLTK